VTLYVTESPDPNGEAGKAPRPDSQLESYIPESHPHKIAVEKTLLEMTRLPGGPWRVEVRPARAYDWWFVRVVARGCGFRHTMALSPQQQNAESVRAAWSRAWLGFEASTKEVPP
jgi:hypothetical protein